MWLWRRNKSSRLESSLGQELAEECEAFLQGRFAGLLDEKRAPVAPWTALNQVAHADVEQLRALAGQRRPPAPLDLPIRDRQEAVAEIAAEMLWLMGEDPLALRQLQLEGLVPLELKLMRTRPQWAVNPYGNLVRQAKAVLDTFPGVSRGSASTAERPARPEDPGDPGRGDEAGGSPGS